MIQRLIDDIESIPLRPAQGFLVYLALGLVRMQVEVLFLDPERGLDFYLVTFLYFYSLLFCFVLIASWVTGVTVERVFRVAIPGSIVILVPLLDILFYPQLRGDGLLELCMLPPPENAIDGLAYLVREILGQRFLFDTQISLGLRLEVFLAALSAGVYVFLRTEHGAWRRWLLSVGVYLLFLCLIYVHALAALHPGTRMWIFTPVIVGECMLLLGAWNRGVLWESLRSFARSQTLLLVVAAFVGFNIRQAVVMPEIPPFAQPFNAMFALIALGYGIGQFATSDDGQFSISETLLGGAAIISLLLGCLVGLEFFLVLAMLWTLAYVCWRSPWRLAEKRAVVALGASLAVWMTTWAGYSIVYTPTALDSFLLAERKAHEAAIAQGESPEELAAKKSSVKPCPDLVRWSRVSTEAFVPSRPLMAPDWFFAPVWLLAPIFLFLISRIRWPGRGSHESRHQH